MEISKIFWAFYDLFRRKQISLAEFSERSKIPEEEIKQILEKLSKKA